MINLSGRRRFTSQRVVLYTVLAERVLFAIASGWQRQAPTLVEELVEYSSSLLSVLNSLTAIYETEARDHAHRVEHQLHGAMEEIKTISKQAQVVAMNARIAAARAGVAGNEFALVATELINITTDIGAILQRCPFTGSRRTLYRTCNVFETTRPWCRFSADQMSPQTFFRNREPLCDIPPSTRSRRFAPRRLERPHRRG